MAASRARTPDDDPGRHLLQRLAAREPCPRGLRLHRAPELLLGQPLDLLTGPLAVVALQQPAVGDRPHLRRHQLRGLAAPLERAGHDRGERQPVEPSGGGPGLRDAGVVEVHALGPPGQDSVGVGRGAAVARQDHGCHARSVRGSQNRAGLRASARGTRLACTCDRRQRAVPQRANGSTSASTPTTWPASGPRPRAPTTSSGWACTSPSRDELEAVADLYDLHELAVEDAISAHQRPKVERYADSLFIVLKTLWYVDEERRRRDRRDQHVRRPQVRHHRPPRRRWRPARRPRTASRRPATCWPTAPPRWCTPCATRSWTATRRSPASLQEDVDEVEQSVFSTERTNDAARIYVLKRELAEMRRAVMPLREPMNRFTAGSVHGIHSDAGPYFRDVADHLNRVADTIDSLDSLLSTAFEAHIAQISIQQNDDMRRISAAVGLIAAPDPGRQHLRHELRPHARAALGARLPDGARPDGAQLAGRLRRSASAPAGCDGSGRR